MHCISMNQKSDCVGEDIFIYQINQTYQFSQTIPPPKLNAPILATSKVIPGVMSSIQEAETGMGFLNAKDAILLQQTLEKTSRPHPYTIRQCSLNRNIK